MVIYVLSVENNHDYDFLKIVTLYSSTCTKLIPFVSCSAPISFSLKSTGDSFQYFLSRT